MNTSTPTETPGWIAWNGGECPVEPEMKVELRLRGPSTWDTGDFVDGITADKFHWQHRDNGADIIAYRIVEPGK